MSRKDALKVGAAVAACGVCCPPLLLVPLGPLAGVGASATAATVALRAPGWLVVALLLITTTKACVAWTRRRSGARRLTAPVEGPVMLRTSR